MTRIEIPLYSYEAEQGLLGALIISPELMPEIVQRLDSKAFHKIGHKEIFDTMRELYLNESVYDSLLLMERLNDRNLLEQIGGRSYISALTDHAIIASNAPEYANVIIDKFERRSLILCLSKSLAQIKGSDEDLDSIKGKLYSELTKVTISKSGLIEPISKIIPRLIANFKNNQSEHGLLGLSTGFKALDAITSGLQKSNLLILAARPAIGKTSLALQIAANCSLFNQKSSLIFSLEMSSEEVALRILGSLARIDTNHLKRGGFNESNPNLEATTNFLLKQRIFCCDKVIETFQKIRMKCIEHQLKLGEINLVVVDYLQLLKSPNQHSNKVNEVSEISRDLKLLAKEIDAPIIAIASLSRSVESRNDKRPILSDLRDSAQIEHDADIVCFIYRDDYYYSNSKNPGVAEIIVAKNRFGESGSIELKFTPEFCRFDDVK